MIHGRSSRLAPCARLHIMSNDNDGRQGSGRRFWWMGGLIGSRGSAGYLQGSLSGPINGLIVPLHPDKVGFRINLLSLAIAG